MVKLRVTLNGTEVSGRLGQTVLELAQANGVDIPTLCHHEDLRPLGACHTPITEGMVIQTHSPKVLAKPLVNSRRYPGIHGVHPEIVKQAGLLPRPVL